MPYYNPGVTDDEFTTQAYTSLGITLGPAFLGVGIDMLCLGIILCQFTVWKVRLEKDERWALKCLVVSQARRGGARLLVSELIRCIVLDDNGQYRTYNLVRPTMSYIPLYTAHV